MNDFILSTYVRQRVCMVHSCHLQYTVGLATMSLAANLCIATSNHLTDPPLLHISNHGYNDLKFWPICSEIVSVNFFKGRYIQCCMGCIDFRDHLVIITSGNALDLATYNGFNNLKPFDRGWSQNSVWTVVVARATVVNYNYQNIWKSSPHTHTLFNTTQMP